MATPKRLIGYANLEKPLKITPHAYDPMLVPKLFTELDPGNLKVSVDQNGEVISSFTESLTLLHAEVAKNTGFKIPDSSNQVLDEVERKKEYKLSAQPKGEFKLDRVVYQKLLKECKNGDVTFVKLRQLQSQPSVIFFGADFHDVDFPAKNLYKALRVAKPDLVIV